MTVELAAMARRGALWLAVLPFLLLSLLPSVVMPVQSDSGFRLVICTGTGPLELATGPAGPADQAPDDDTSHCHWAAGKAGWALALPVGLALAVDRSSVAEVAAPSFVLRVGRATGLPPSTGPPRAV